MFGSASGTFRVETEVGANSAASPVTGSPAGEAAEVKKKNKTSPSNGGNFSLDEVEGRRRRRKKVEKASMWVS